MREEGVIGPEEEPTDEEVRRFDKKRKNKKVSNEEWESPTDPDARIAQMKDGTTHLAYKAEHVVDLESDLVLAAEIYPADHADTATLADSVVAAQVNLKEAGQRGVDRRGGGGQGLPRGGDDRDVRLPRRADVHPGAEAAASADSGRTSRRPQRRGGDEQPSSGGAGQGEGAAAAAERGGGADVRAHLRDGRVAAESSARPGERDQTVPDRGGGAQPGSDPARLTGSANRRPCRAPAALPRSCRVSPRGSDVLG